MDGFSLSGRQHGNGLPIVFSAPSLPEKTGRVAVSSAGPVLPSGSYPGDQTPLPKRSVSMFTPEGQAFHATGRACESNPLLFLAKVALDKAREEGFWTPESKDSNQPRLKRGRKVKKYVCPVEGCDFDGTFLLFTRHLKQIHKDEARKLAISLINGEATPSVSDELRERLSMYICRHNKAKSSELCAKLFGYKTEFDRHVATHTGEGKFVCSEIKEDGNVCGKRFAQKASLTSHLKRSGISGSHN